MLPPLNDIAVGNARYDIILHRVMQEHHLSLMKEVIWYGITAAAKCIQCYIAKSSSWVKKVNELDECTSKKCTNAHSMIVHSLYELFDTNIKN